MFVIVLLGEVLDLARYQLLFFLQLGVDLVQGTTDFTCHWLVFIKFVLRVPMQLA